MEQKTIKIADLEVNRGQIDGLPKNPRTIKDERFKALKKSIEDAPEMLALRELLVYPHNGKFVVIGGNMRLKACKELGYKELPCKIIDENTPVEKLREYTIKDNIGFGTDDWGALFEDWNTDELADWGLEFPEDINVDETQETEIVEDEVPEDVETRCKLGDIWELGEHRLMCGDSTSAECFAGLMQGERADIAFTSPPYNANKSKVGMVESKKHGKMTSYTDGEMYNEYTDDVSDEEYGKLLCSTLQNCLKNADDVLYNIGILAGSKVGIIEMLSQFKSKFMDILFWNKNNAMPMGLPTQFGLLNHKVEPVFCFNNKGNRKFTYPQWQIGKMTNEIVSKNASTNEYSNIHHATFPVEFAGAIVSNFAREDGIVIDCFGGTGSTLIACEQLNRKCFMMELDEHYCDVIIARWEKLTGKTAVKINE